jgi:hypothetical protein
MNKLKSALLYFWTHHVQKTIAYVTGALLTVDLTGYAGPIKELIGVKGFDILLLALAAVVGIRAHSQPPAPPLPPP